MTLKFTDYGKQKVLNSFKSDTSTGPSLLRLFTSNTTITHDTAVGDLTEASFGGYAAEDIAGDGTVSENGSDEGELVYPTATFTASGTGLPVDVYGYYVTDFSGNLLWAEKDPTGPITLTNPGDQVTVDAVVTLTNVSAP